MRRALLLTVLLVVGACSGGETTATTVAVETAEAAETTVAVDEATTTEPPSVTTIESTAPESSVEPDTKETADFRDVLVVEILALGDVTESGPHPTLTWQTVDGAATYWLVVADGDGEPYWAWTGPETAVRFGGGDSAEPNQTAILHESMTWVVAGFDSAGALVALSEPGTISP